MAWVTKLMGKEDFFKLIIVFATCCFLGCTSVAHAHSGGLDSEGCHYVRSTNPSEYHCHRSSSVKALDRKESVASRYATNWIMFGIFVGIIWLLFRDDGDNK
jgi:hypothetical protein